MSAWCASASAFSVEQQGSVAVRTGGKKVLLLSFVVAGWGGAKVCNVMQNGEE